MYTLTSRRVSHDARRRHSATDPPSRTGTSPVRLLLLLVCLLSLAVANMTAIAAGTPKKLGFGQQPTNTVAGATITPAVTVRVLDSQGRLVTTATNAITLAIYTNPGGGTLSGTLTKNAVGGIATFNDLSIDKTGTGYKLRATATGLTAATSNAFNITPGTPTQLAFYQQPTNAVAGVAITPAVTVRILDAFGNLTTATNAVTMAIDTNPGGGTLSGTLTKNAVSGTATFNDLSIDKTGTGYKLRATATGLTQAVSNAFNITPGTPSQLVFGQQPTTTDAGATITPAVTVNLLDAQGNQTSGTNAVTMAIGTNPGGGTLSGTLTKNAVNGTATFNNLSINNAGTGYTLRATATGLTLADSNPFDILSIAGTPISIGGVPQCPILVVNLTPGDLCYDAAVDMKVWLDQMTGGSFSIQAYTPEATSGIIIGTAAQFPTQATQYNVNQTTVGAEGYRVVPDDARLWILSTSALGAEHGTYGVLESLGCRWLIPDPTWYIIPGKPDITVTLDVTEKPAYDFLRIWYGWGGQPGDLAGWHKRNLMTHSFYASCGEMWEIVLSSAEFAAHPEWAALVGGTRTNWQLCVSNPDLQDHFVLQHVFPTLNTSQTTSVEPADGGGFCECSVCAAIGQGTPSDEAIWLANISARAATLTYPGQDKWVCQLAYAYHSAPPHYPMTGSCPEWINPGHSGTITFDQFEPNVYMQITNGFNFSGLSTMQLLAALRAQGLQKAGTYEYYSYMQQDKPEEEASFYYAVADMIEAYHDNSVSTMDCESQCNWAPNGLCYWITSRLAWDPHQSVDVLVQEYCDNAYGKASAPMRRYHDRMANGIRYNKLFMRDSLEDLKEAYSLEGRPEYVARLDRVAMYLHDMRLMYEHKMARETQQPIEVINEIDHRWVNWIRRIWDTQMIDSKIDLYDEPISGQMFYPNDAAANVPPEMAVWKTERTDLPTSSEMIGVFDDDYTYFFGVPLVDPYLKGFSVDLVPINDVRPDLVNAWGTVTENLGYFEDSVYYFRGQADEELTVTVIPFGGQGGGHNMNGRPWSINQVNTDTGAETSVESGTYVCESGDTCYINVTLPNDGLYILRPGTYYWSAATCVFSPARPNSLLATRNNFRQWWCSLPNAFFYVPKGTTGFTINVTDNGGMDSPVNIWTADGTKVFTYPAIPQNNRPSLVVTVPAGKDDQIWKIDMLGGRLQYYIEGIPQYVSFTPAKLLVPKETVRVVADSQTVNTSENTPVNGTLTATSAFSEPLTYSLVNGEGAHVTTLISVRGTLTITNPSTGAFSYTPKTDAWGTDVFSFVASDSQCTSMPAKLTVNIASVPQAPAPTANDMSLTTSVNLSVRGQFSVTDPTNDAVTFTIVQNGTKGIATLVNASTGTFIYVPTPGQTGQDTVIFTANDGYGTSNQGTVTITINP